MVIGSGLNCVLIGISPQAWGRMLFSTVSVFADPVLLGWSLPGLSSVLPSRSVDLSFKTLS